MHGRMARYAIQGDAHELARTAEEGMLPIFQSQPGFKAYSLLESGDEIISFSAWESADDAEAWWVADLDVHNPLTSYRFLLAEGRSHPRWLNGSGVHRRDVTDAHDFRVSTEHRLPDWVEDQVGYQVFPDRFERTATGLPTPDWATPADWDDPVVHRGRTTSTQLYGGTLDGVRERLDHLTDLGATLLYLTPVFEARSNHRYDAVSFDRVDPLLGGDAALSALLGAAHGAGLRVVGDLTTNHTGSAHDWFALARADEGNPEREFYLFEGDEYASWLGHLHLPKLDHRSAEGDTLLRLHRAVRSLALPGRPPIKRLHAASSVSRA